jgi:ketosteroid isomerase-like protein
MEIKKMVQGFYKAAGQKNNDWQIDLSDCISFADADFKTHSEGKEAFVTTYTNVLRVMSSITIKQIIADARSACAIISYEYVNQQGEKLRQDSAEVWVEKDGKLNSYTIYLDLTVLWKFLGR